MAETGDKIKITIRQSSGDQFEVQIAPSSTVLELKQLCTEKTQLPAESQRLIFKGKCPRRSVLTLIVGSALMIPYLSPVGRFFYKNERPQLAVNMRLRAE